MTRDDIRAEFARFIEFPPDSDGKYVTTASALLFAEHVAKMTAEKPAAPSPAPIGWRELLQQARVVLKFGKTKNDVIAKDLVGRIEAALQAPTQPGWCEDCSPENCSGCGGTLIPATGSEWRHKNGNRYTVIGKANMDTTKPDEYPQTVIYSGDNGKVWSRPLSRWHDSMTPIDGQEEARQ